MKDLARKFQDIITIKYSTEVKTRRSAGMGDEFVLVLLRHQGLLRDTYYLNLRPKKEDDDVYSNRFGLFGGKIDKDDENQPIETAEAAMEREIFEETGLRAGQQAYWLADITGYNNVMKKTDGTLYLKVLRKSPYRTIKNYLKDENPRLTAAGRNPIGKIIPIHRYRGGLHFFFRWWRLTPQAAFALRDVLDRDPTKVRQKFGDVQKTADIGPNREKPPGSPEGARCVHCGGHLTRDDQYRGICPHCEKRV